MKHQKQFQQKFHEMQEGSFRLLEKEEGAESNKTVLGLSDMLCAMLGGVTRREQGAALAMVTAWYCLGNRNSRRIALVAAKEIDEIIRSYIEHVTKP